MSAQREILKVGDRVKIYVSRESAYYNGQLGTIVAFYGVGTYNIRVKLENKLDFVLLFAESELTKVEDTPELTPRQRADRLREDWKALSNDGWKVDTFPKSSELHIYKEIKL